MSKKPAIGLKSRVADREFMDAYKHASDCQRINMLLSQRAALIRCEEWLTKSVMHGKFDNNQPMREAILRLSRVIESTPLDYDGHPGYIHE